jgi:hypothetical protein
MQNHKYNTDLNPYSSVAEFHETEKIANSLKSVLDWFEYSHKLKISFENVGSSKYDNRYVFKIVDICMRPHHTMIGETEHYYIQDALWDGVAAAKRCTYEDGKLPTVGYILFQQTIDAIEKDITNQDTV